MAKAQVFDALHRRYEAWFARHHAAYWSELLAVRVLLPWRGVGLEVGVGSGRFAGPLGVQVGLDPSEPMLAYARQRGIRAVRGVAEALPFADAAFDYVLIVTTICFVDDPQAMLDEARRVLRPDGHVVLGFIDRASVVGRAYLARQAHDEFYREARFYSAEEVADLLIESEFAHLEWAQTLSGPLEALQDPEPPREGYGQGAFVVVRGTHAERIGYAWGATTSGTGKVPGT